MDNICSQFVNYHNSYFPHNIKTRISKKRSRNHFSRYPDQVFMYVI